MDKLRLQSVHQSWVKESVKYLRGPSVNLQKLEADISRYQVVDPWIEYCSLVPVARAILDRGHTEVVTDVHESWLRVRGGIEDLT